MRKVWKKVRILNATICAFIWTSSPGSKASLQSSSCPFYPRQSESLASFQVTKSTEQNLCDADMNHNIPIVSHFEYIGKYIYSSLGKKTMRKNSTQIMKAMDMLCRLPNSPSARIAIIKMNVLPKIDFYSFISCLSLPPKYWGHLHQIISQLIWKCKHPKMKMKTLPQGKKKFVVSLYEYTLCFTSASFIRLVQWW